MLYLLTFNWPGLWTRLFGSADGWFGISWGFWVAIIIVGIVVIFENAFFWSRKPKDPERRKKKKEKED